MVFKSKKPAFGKVPKSIPHYDVPEYTQAQQLEDQIALDRLRTQFFASTTEGVIRVIADLRTSEEGIDARLTHLMVEGQGIRHYNLNEWIRRILLSGLPENFRASTRSDAKFIVEKLIERHGRELFEEPPLTPEQAGKVSNRVKDTQAKVREVEKPVRKRRRRRFGRKEEPSPSIKTIIGGISNVEEAPKPQTEGGIKVPKVKELAADSIKVAPTAPTAQPVPAFEQFENEEGDGNSLVKIGAFAAAGLVATAGFALHQKHQSKDFESKFKKDSPKNELVTDVTVPKTEALMQSLMESANALISGSKDEKSGNKANDLVETPPEMFVDAPIEQCQIEMTEDSMTTKLGVVKLRAQRVVNFEKNLIVAEAEYNRLKANGASLDEINNLKEMFSRIDFIRANSNLYMMQLLIREFSPNSDTQKEHKAAIQGCLDTIEHSFENDMKPIYSRLGVYIDGLKPSVAEETPVNKSQANDLNNQEIASLIQVDTPLTEKECQMIGTFCAHLRYPSQMIKEFSTLERSLDDPTSKITLDYIHKLKAWFAPIDIDGASKNIVLAGQEFQQVKDLVEPELGEKIEKLFATLPQEIETNLKPFYQRLIKRIDRLEVKLLGRAARLEEAQETQIKEVVQDTVLVAASAVEVPVKSAEVEVFDDILETHMDPIDVLTSKNQLVSVSKSAGKDKIAQSLAEFSVDNRTDSIILLHQNGKWHQSAKTDFNDSDIDLEEEGLLDRVTVHLDTSQVYMLNQAGIDSLLQG